jgi:type IV fimbrial biogenesis protein FimT
MSGFTLVETIIVILIVAVMAAIGFPAMNQMISSQRAKTAAFDLLADITFARAEAIARGVDVVMASAGGGTDWATGWTITEQGGPSVLRTSSSRSSDVAFTGTASSITFERTGRVTAGATVAFSIAPTKAGTQEFQKRCVRLDPSGRPRSVQGACS